MKTKLVTSAVFAATLFALGARGQSQAPVVTPSPAPPVVGNTPAPLPAPNQIVYAPRLPSATDLSNAAAAQGLTIERIEQTATQMTAVFKNSNGQTNTVSYQLLPPAGAPAASQVVAPANPPTTVIYERAPRVVYYDTYDPYYYPRYWYPPVSLHLGFGHYGHGGHRHRHWRR